MSEEQSLTLEHDRPSTPAKLVRIGPFHDLLDANLAVAKLQEEGIRASLAGEHLAATLGPVYGAAYAGGPVVLVPQEEEAEARAIVASVEQKRRDRMNADSPACPSCKKRPSTPVLHGLRWWAILLLVAAFVGSGFGPIGIIAFVASVTLFIWPVIPAWKCNHCGQRFFAPKPKPATETAAE